LLINIIRRQLLLYIKSARDYLTFKMLTSKMLRDSIGFLRLTPIQPRVHVCSTYAFGIVWYTRRVYPGETWSCIKEGRDFWVLFSNGYDKHGSLRKKYVVKDAFYRGNIRTLAINFSRITESQKDKANANDRDENNGVIEFL